MKYLIVSDIHGSLPQLELVLDYYENHQYDMLIILGDIINYGPRNGVPEGLNAMGIVERLNALANKIVAVRGNCDSEVDQMLLKFPCLADYLIMVVDGKRLFLTHGHIYNPEKRTTLDIDAFFYGHTHQQELRKAEDDVLICNTGSITFPKGGNVPTFATIDEDRIVRLRQLDGSILNECKL